MAEAQSQPFDLIAPTTMLLRIRYLPIEKRQIVLYIAKGPCQPTDGTFPKNNNGRRFLTAWYEKFKWIEYSRKTKLFAFSAAHSGSLYRSPSWLRTRVSLYTFWVFFSPCLHESGSVVIWEKLYQPGSDLLNPGWKYFSRPSKAMRSNLSWWDLLRSYMTF